ncbi:MAG TPA: hypothetical protein VFB89_06235 [Gemmatimonadales bacterium]|nr:hypothetical protein [Gemmatimonadales bacterium]
MIDCARLGSAQRCSARPGWGQAETYENALPARKIANDLAHRTGELAYQRGNGNDLILASTMRVFQ